MMSQKDCQTEGDGKMRQAEATRPLHLSEAQVQRLKRRYQPDLLFLPCRFSSVLPLQELLPLSTSCLSVPSVFPQIFAHRRNSCFRSAGTASQ
jgi:hypothetical protein